MYIQIKCLHLLAKKTKSRRMSPHTTTLDATKHEESIGTLFCLTYFCSHRLCPNVVLLDGVKLYVKNVACVDFHVCFIKLTLFVPFFRRRSP